MAGMWGVNQRTEVSFLSVSQANYQLCLKESIASKDDNYSKFNLCCIAYFAEDRNSKLEEIADLKKISQITTDREKLKMQKN